MKVDSIDVNYHSTEIDDQQLITTPLMRAIKITDIELAELIIHHPSFDPSKARLKVAFSIPLAAKIWIYSDFC